MTRDERPVIAGLRLTWQTFRAPGRPGEARAKVAFGLWAPDDPDTTLDQITQEEFDRSDERMPYFAAIWASGESLAARVLAGPRLDGWHVLDLGCGLGPCGFAAAHQGANVTFFDWEPRALQIVAASAIEQDTPATAFEFVVGDWREPPPFGPFDLILGADVLYERRNAPAVAAFLGHHLRPDEEAWIADPGRPQAEQFPAYARHEGLELLGDEILPPVHEPGTTPLEVRLLRLRRPR